mmetsp:Transcript_5430/g.10367  ORF Transcript_5430/g.10367 Transcript_5430/m.10367 type:complete len:520 (-) Transcript_5430:152-1711(-)
MRPPPTRSWQQIQSSTATDKQNKLWAREVPFLVEKHRHDDGTGSPHQGDGRYVPAGPNTVGSDGTSAMQWVTHVQDLYKSNMAKTRKGVSLSFAPPKPFYNRTPLEMLPVFMPKEEQKWWHWVVFALLLGVILLVGVFLSAIFEDVGEGIQTYTRAQRQKLAHLPMYGLVTGEPVMGDAIYEPKDHLAIKALLKYIVNPERKEGDSSWTEQALRLADELLVEGKAISLLFVGDVFETWRATWHGKQCANHDCTSVKLLVEKDISAHKLAKHKKHVISAYGDETTQNLLWRITEIEGFNQTNPTVCVVMIGGADLQAGRTAEEIAAGVRANLRALQKRMKDTFFLIVGLLPRADDVYMKRVKEIRAQPGGRAKREQDVNNEIEKISYDSSTWFNKIFTVNRWLLKLTDDASQWSKSFPQMYPPVNFLDCSSSFLTQGVLRVSAPPLSLMPLDLIPDGHHLSPMGHTKLAGCILGKVSELTALAAEDEANGNARQRKKNRAKAESLKERSKTPGAKHASNT